MSCATPLFSEDIHNLQVDALCIHDLMGSYNCYLCCRLTEEDIQFNTLVALADLTHLASHIARGGGR